MSHFLDTKVSRLRVGYSEKSRLRGLLARSYRVDKHFLDKRMIAYRKRPKALLCCVAMISSKCRGRLERFVQLMWDTQSVQLVWFISTHEGLNTQDLYRSAFGADPDSTQSNRSVSPTAPFLSQATGVIAGRRLVLQLQPGRLDLIVQAEQSEIDVDKGIRVLNLLEELDELQGPLSKISNSLSSVIRISTVATLSASTDSAESALKKCIEQIEFPCPTQAVTDFVFQANRRTTLGGKYEVNRLLRWVVFEMHSMAINVDAIGQQSMSSFVQHRAGLVLDFNTLLQTQPYSHESQIEAMSLVHSEVSRFAQLEHPLREFAL